MRHEALKPRTEASRTGAVWLAGTGAFLILVASAVFVAVRWDEIPDGAKLAAVGALTGAFLLAGHTLHRTLPASAGALFHLGAFLLPVDVAAIGVHLGAGWDGLLLAEGVVGTVAFWLLGRVQRSVLLDRAAALAVIALAGGLGAFTPLPAPVLLAVAALTAELTGARRAALAWAGLAGLAPALAAAEALAVSAASATGAGVLERLGLTGHEPRVTGVLTGLVCAVILGRQGRRHNDPGLALLAVAVGLVGLAATWTGIDADTAPTGVGLAGLFLVIEVAALVVRRDPFWREPAHIVAVLGEMGAAVATTALGVSVVVARIVTEQDWRSPETALAAGLLAVGWLAADLRRGVPSSTPPGMALLVGTGWVPGTIGLTVATVSAVVWGWSDPVAVAAAMVAVAGLLVVSGRAGGHPLVAFLAVWAPLTAGEHPVAAVAVGLIGSLLLAEAAVARWRADGRDPWPPKLAAASLVPALVAALAAANWYEPGSVLVAGAFAAWLLALSLDRAELGWLPRLAALALLGAVTSLTAADAAILAAVIAGLAAVDAARLDQPLIAVGTSVGTPVAVGSLCLATGLPLGDVGVALCLLGVVTVGLAAVVEDRWAVPFLAATGLMVAGGLLLASNDPRALADALLVTGGLVLAVGLVQRVPPAELAGAATATLGLWLRLGHAGVAATEAYVAPVALVLLVAGLRARQGSDPANSWEAYGPAIALLGVSALAERMSGGGGGHALVVGAIAVAAVAAGGWRRLAGPLVIGTALLVMVTGYESLAVTASVPTHAWLALGGAVLLGAGIAMERADTGPVETGRRLVDVLRDRFA